MPSSIGPTSPRAPCAAPDMLARAAAQVGAAPEAVKLSPAFANAGARHIIGDWLSTRSRNLPPEQQAMVSSMLAHLENSPEADLVDRQLFRLRFRFSHPQGTRPCNLAGELNVNSNGEVIAISISAEGGNGRAMTLLKPVGMCRLPSLGGAAREHLLERLPDPPGKRRQATDGSRVSAHAAAWQAITNWEAELLGTRYDDIGLTSLAKEVLDELDPETTPRRFYDRLRESNGETGRNWRRGYPGVLVKFGSFLAENEVSLRDVVKSFRAFASVAHAFQSNKDARVKQMLRHLCEMSFGALPLEKYVRSRMANEESPFHTMSREEAESVAAAGDVSGAERVRGGLGPVYLIETQIAAGGAESAAEFLTGADRQEVTRKLLDVFEQVAKENSRWNILAHFRPFLLADVFDPTLGTVVLQAARDCIAESTRRTGRPPARKTMDSHTRVAIRLAAYACEKCMSHDAFLELLTPGSDENKRAEEETGLDSRQFGTTINAIADGIRSRLKKENSASTQAARDA